MRIGVAALVAVAAATAACGTARASLLPPGWKQIKTGPAGGTVWEGELPGASWGHSFTRSYVYLPPNVSTGKRYPVLYVLHGFYGSPSSIVYGIALGDTADRLIQQGLVRPFIMVAPSGNASTLYGGEWTGPRESFVVDSVVPGADARLPTIAQRSGRVIAGLSAGAYGAVDIALRHPQLFATAESWSGYFKPIADGTLHGASRAEMAAHDPSQLARSKAPLVRPAPDALLPLVRGDARPGHRVVRAGVRPGAIGAAHQTQPAPAPGRARREVLARAAARRARVRVQPRRLKRIRRTTTPVTSTRGCPARRPPARPAATAPRRRRTVLARRSCVQSSTRTQTASRAPSRPCR